MLINKLNTETCRGGQAATISKARSLAREIIKNQTCPSQLLRYSERLYELSKQHPAANSLQKEAEAATQKSVDIQSQPEHVAVTVIRDGAAFLRQHGRHPNNRLLAMRDRYGSWTAVHVRLIQNGFGGKNFQWLRSRNKLELTSEWFVARFARHLVSADTLFALDTLLSTNVPAYRNAA